MDLSSIDFNLFFQFFNFFVVVYRSRLWWTRDYIGLTGRWLTYNFFLIMQLKNVQLGQSSRLQQSFQQVSRWLSIVVGN